MELPATSNHSTTLSPEQRENLVNMLTMFHKIEDLAVMTDVQLHQRWLDDCNGVD